MDAGAHEDAAGDDVSNDSELVVEEHNVKNVVELAKEKWVGHLVKDTKLMVMIPKKSWEHINILTEGHVGHHAQKKYS